MAGKQAVKRSVLKVPQDLTEAAEFVRQIGEAQRAIERINSDLNRKVEALKAEATAATQPHAAKIEQRRDGLYVFAEAHRGELTEDGKRKSVEVPTGTFGWRMTPPSVSLRGIKTIIAVLKRLNLKRFIRTQEEVDKEAMLKEPDAVKGIKGVTIGQREEFFMKPAEIKAEISADAEKLKKAVA